MTPAVFTTPDMGADEFTGVDNAGPAITYTPVTSSCSTDPVTLTASITDFSGVPTSGAGLPVLYWKVNAGAYTAATGTFVSGSNYSFTFGGGVSGDVISYYIAAQDALGNVSTFPSAGAGGFTFLPTHRRQVLLQQRRVLIPFSQRSVVPIQLVLRKLRNLNGCHSCIQYQLWSARLCLNCSMHLTPPRLKHSMWRSTLTPAQAAPIR